MEVRSERESEDNHRGRNLVRIGDLSGVPAVGFVKANAPKITSPNAPKMAGQMPLANAPNAPTVSVENVEFAKPSGWSKLWRMERNGKYFKFKLRFTDTKDTPRELQKVIRQGGKITPKIESALAKRPGKGNHAASRVEAGRFRSRAIDLAGRIRSSSRRGIEREVGAFEGRPDHAAPDLNRDLERGHMPQLPGMDGADDMPGVRESDWVM